MKTGFKFCFVQIINLCRYTLVHVFVLRRRAHVTSEAFWRWCYITAQEKMQRWGYTLNSVS